MSAEVEHAERMVRIGGADDLELITARNRLAHLQLASTEALYRLNKGRLDMAAANGTVEKFVDNWR
jgi:hypothetical protein